MDRESVLRLEAPRRELISRARSFSLATSKNRCKKMDNEKALRFELECRRTGKCREIVADVQHSRMPRHMEQEACSLAAKSIMTYHLEHDIARHLKLAFDKEYGPDWHCICGKHFGSFVTFEPDSFIYFRIGTIAFMLFKTSLQRLPIMEKHLENVKLTPKTILGRSRLMTPKSEDDEESTSASDVS
ncbi:CRE-DLC-5 protein [Caenorhabditis remanei]|uniref:CRE-DLC-5 protein n=2 Tax=Caenorhabditis remanei TaxID=31234 RepID=E3MS73_CAERE|nr:CRE-DLC-5 protein [Caenorhabditis remanei]